MVYDVRNVRRNAKMKVFQNKKYMILLCVAGVLLLPVIIAILVSLPILPKLANSNDWIGFWGGYLGSILGGIITLFVLKITIDDNNRLKKRDEKISYYNHLTKLYASLGATTGDLCLLANRYIKDNCQENREVFIQKFNVIYSLMAEISILLESSLEVYDVKKFYDKYQAIIDEIDRISTMVENEEVTDIMDIGNEMDKLLEEITVGDNILVEVIKNDLYA